MVAQGQAARQPQPWVTIQTKPTFFIIRPRERRMMKSWMKSQSCFPHCLRIYQETMDDIKKFLDNFLDSPVPGVIAIKGDWGAGKTYYITHYLQNRPQIKNKLVSFVSLFGLTDIEQVRRSIMPSAVSAKKLTEGKTASWLQKTLRIVRRAPKVSDLESVFTELENYLTRDLLIVFDDVERKSEELSLKSFLGLVNFLAEQAECKVIIILNEDQLSEADKKELGIFREKLIDREVLFAPGYVDNAKLFFHDQRLFDRALDVFTSVECRNLRVINKCHLAVKEFERELSSLEREYREPVLEQVIVLACLYYQFGGKVDFSDLHDSYIRNMFDKGKKPKSESAEILKKAGYIPKDSDNVIINYLTTGLFDASATASLIKKQATTGERGDLQRNERAIYRMLWANLHGTSEEFCRKMSEFLDSNLDRLTRNEIVQASAALQAVGFTGDTKKWLDAFIISHAPSATYEDLDIFSQSAHSGEAKKAVAERRSSLLRSRHPKEIIYAMYQRSGWNQEDIAALNAYSIDEYVEWLRAADDEHLLRILREFVRTFNPQQTTADWKSIGEKLFSAFRILATGNNFVRYKLVNNVEVPTASLDEPDIAGAQNLPVAE
jgi:hypothetical protein